VDKYRLGIIPNIKGNMNLLEGLQWIKNLNQYEESFREHTATVWSGSEWVDISNSGKTLDGKK
jgi:hypothetical protein